MYPAGAPPKADDWTLDTFLKAAEACHKGGNPFGIGLGTTVGLGRHDRRDLPLLRRRAGRRQGRDRGQERSGPPGARLLQEADGSSCRPTCRRGTIASNNKWLVSGQGALIMNPPSAWAVAKRDAPQGRRAVLDARLPGRAQGPLRAVPAVLLGHLELQQEPVGGQEPARAICRRPRRPRRWWSPAAATTCRRSPSSRPSRPGPRKGRPRARSTTIPTRTITRSCSIAAAPAPHKIAEQIYTQGIADPDGRPLLQGRGHGQDARLGVEARSKASCATRQAQGDRRALPSDGAPPRLHENLQRRS